MFRNYRRLLAVWLSDFGRSEGWIIERAGLPIGKLRDAAFAEMFWDLYHVEECVDDLTQVSVLADEFWTQFDFKNIKFRSIATDEVIDSAIPKIQPPDELGRVVIRGLYIPVREPSVLERGVLALIRKLAMGPKKGQEPNW